MSDNNESAHSSQFQAMVEAMKSRKLMFPDMTNYIAIMNRDVMRKMNEAVMPKGQQDHQFDFGMDTLSSDFVDSDKVFFVPKYTQQAFSTARSIIDFKDIPDGFTQEIEQRIWSRIAGAFGLPSDLISGTRDRSNDWKRRKNESFSSWGMRLEKLGLIDDQTYRLAYQRAVQMAVITSPIRFVKWLLKLRIRKIE